MMNWNWASEYLLTFVIAVVTLFLLWQYVWEKRRGIGLSKKYRNSIFETQSKIFLNATQHLISGDKDQAIKEFLSAVDLNRETLETYFALGGLFRSNGEIDKAISIHRSIIARESVTESTRVRALKELAIDFDKGGFVDKAIETYRDVLKINRDQFEVIQALCRIYEDIGDWNQAYNYRVMLSKVSRENQAETISHVLVQKAKQSFDKGLWHECEEDLQDAFRFSPSVSAKILKLQLLLVKGDIDEAQGLFLECIRQHPIYVIFILDSLSQVPKHTAAEPYLNLLDVLKKFFLLLRDPNIESLPAIVLARVRLFKEKGELVQAKDCVQRWLERWPQFNEALKVEFIKILILLEEKDLAISYMKSLLDGQHQTLARYFCERCGYNSDEIFWRCPQCREWETIKFRWKV
jgi:lipopolysaccharide assembly protein B